MSQATAIVRNLDFWHWYPELMVEGLSREQLCWQPEGHDTSITFAIWHTYRAADELCHGLAIGRPSVYSRDGWAKRLPVEETGASPFGNAMTREQIARLDFEPGELVAYAKAVGESLKQWVAEAPDETLAEMVELPFFAKAYPGYDRMSKGEVITFFGIGHTAEHLGEVQMVRGLMGLKGAPL